MHASHTGDKDLGTPYLGFICDHCGNIFNLSTHLRKNTVNRHRGCSKLYHMWQMVKIRLSLEDSYAQPLWRETTSELFSGLQDGPRLGPDVLLIKSSILTLWYGLGNSSSVLNISSLADLWFLNILHRDDKRSGSASTFYYVKMLCVKESSWNYQTHRNELENIEKRFSQGFHARIRPKSA